MYIMYLLVMGCTVILKSIKIEINPKLNLKLILQLVSVLCNFQSLLIPQKCHLIYHAAIISVQSLRDPLNLILSFRLSRKVATNDEVFISTNYPPRCSREFAGREASSFG